MKEAEKDNTKTASTSTITSSFVKVDVDHVERTNVDNSLVQLALEKLAIVSATLGSQQETNDLLNDINKLVEKYSNDRLNTAISPAVVLVQKGRNKSTKRDKIALEHQEDVLKKERKVEKRKQKNEEEEKKQMKKAKKEIKNIYTTAAARNAR